MVIRSRKYKWRGMFALYVSVQVNLATAEGGNSVSVGLHHAADGGEMVVFGDAGPKLAHHRTGGEDLFVGRCRGDDDVFGHAATIRRVPWNWSKKASERKK